MPFDLEFAPAYGAPGLHRVGMLPVPFPPAGVAAEFLPAPARRHVQGLAALPAPSLLGFAPASDGLYRPERGFRFPCSFFPRP